ncbi:homeobox protein knotted-1-like 2 [Malania oleifera]|uniref:homeobox protein knotted-1-like 2 n=1 Tax=Malania oleifera TaxID=397392 RepID=UPI0025AEB912|nr:homeobox protein knotted-1-like 2 [Malania oleifera]
MAFHGHLSHEMALQHFTEQHLGENAAVLRGISPEHLGRTSSSDREDPNPKDVHRLILESAVKPTADHHHPPLPPFSGGTGAPTWLNSPILRQQGQFADGRFLHLQTNSESPGRWLPRENDDVAASSRESNGREAMECGTGAENWESARYKADVLAHPLYEQLLSAHVSCLRIATPVDQLPRIDAQLAQSPRVAAKYPVVGNAGEGLNEKELDQFMTHYVLLLCSFKEQLQQHVRVHAMEAVMACWELEQSLQSLTGVSSGEGTGATMSDDDDNQVDGDTNLYDGSLDGADTMGFGPLVPTESERSLMERVRQELKHELKQGYKEKIVDVREEILRKRRAGKLPGDTTSLLKAWWQAHSKWPYPTEEDKTKLVQETGLQLKQINNWFINQRKRNWHSNASSSSVSKSKRKR